MQRRILYHVTPETKASPIYYEMVTQLAHSMQRYADIELSFTREDNTCGHLAGYDLVHVFGCWNKEAIRLLDTLYACHVPTIFSPLGGLQPWIIRQHKSHMIFTSQRDAVRKALTVHVCGKLEYETFVSLKWNTHVALIKNPVLTSKVSFTEMSDQMSQLYQKVVDSYARLLLNPKSCKVIGGLLALGTDPTIVRDKKRINNLSLLLKDIDEIEWRKVFLYASDERILDVLISGINRLQMDIPITDVSDIERYASDYNYPNGALDGQKLLSRNPLTKSKLNDVFESKNEREKSIIVQLLNFKYEIEHQIAPMSHLADIYQIIRFSDVDEDKLKEAAHSMGIQEFSQRLMAVLQDTLGLTEGFMPFIAKNDKVAQELTQAITKFNTY